MKRVLVLDANQRCALAVTRSLGKQNIPIITADETPQTLAGSSCFSIQNFTYPSPRVESEQFVEFLTKLVNEQDIEIILPMTELTTTLLLTHQSLLASTAILPYPDIETVDALANKCSLMRLAQSLNIPIPNTWHANHPNQLPINLEELPYPLVLKPGKSWLLLDKEWIRCGVRFANNPLNAKEILESDPAFQAHPFMIQQCVSGSGQGIFALYDHGRPIAFFSHRRLREKPPSGGVSVLSESVPINQRILSHARALLEHSNWHGVAMVEFKVDQSDGTPYLMEVNTRFWGSLQLAIDAGVNFPWLLYQLACDSKPNLADNYRLGIRLRWLLGDLDNLYLTLRDRRYSSIEKMRSLLRFLTPSPFKTRHEIDRWEDLGPFWYELKQYLRDLTH